MTFEIDSNVKVSRDGEGKVRKLSHPLRGFQGSPAMVAPSARALAEEYLRDVGHILEIPQETMRNFAAAIETEAPSSDEMDLRFHEEKEVVDIANVTYAQTQYGLPVWNAGITVRVRLDTPQVTGSQNAYHYDLDVQPPSGPAAYGPSGIDEATLAGLLAPAGVQATPKINAKKAWIYQYDPEERLDPAATGGGDDDFEQAPPTLDLPPVPDEVTPGRHYIVTEVLFTLPTEGWGDLNWRAMVEAETGVILYLRALVACQAPTGLVFETDPISMGSNLGAHATAAELDQQRTRVQLAGLATPASAADPQQLSGEFVVMVDNDPPTTTPPEEPEPFRFDYSAVTNDFSAVNAYCHCDGVFRMIQGMGIDLSSYFDGTSFPVPVDHWAFGGAVNARAPGNALGNGSGGFQFGRAAANSPVGIANTLRVVLHEFGHALLWDHVNSPNFGFAHSPGDSLAVILHDPESQAADRFDTFPFMTASNGQVFRRHDRDVAAGWAWGGLRDNRQYGSEQILSTTLFRVYRAFGGDDPDVDVQRFAARYVAYLIIKSIGLLSFMTRDPEVYVDALMETDINTTDFEGHPGGALHKVIRWSFEQQGLYQAPGTSGPVTAPGQPPDVDVFIDDGRNGDYMPYPASLGDSADIWNRNAADDGTTHQDPGAGAANHLYVRVRNRGLLDAENVVVKGFQSQIADNPTWPADWAPLATAQIPLDQALPPGGEAIVGPFEWLPQLANPTVLVSASADGDVGNTEIVGNEIALARLIPTDNNLAMREM